MALYRITPSTAKVSIYADEGITGTSAKKRKDFQRLLADCRNGRIDKVLVKSISRFARNTTECLEAVRELKSLGISIFFEEHNIDTKMVSSEMLTAVIASCAQAESESISRNMRWSVQKRMESGTFNTCRAATGFRLGEDGLRIAPEEAPVIYGIFADYLQGKNSREIAERLNAENALGRIWNRKLVDYILTNERYAGNAILQKKYRTETFPRIKKASVNFKKLYGYYLDDGGNPQVNSDQAEAVRSIYDQYLQGASLRMIKLSLEGKAVPNPTGGAKWDISQIRSILGNEKYCGDVLMQKTFTQDCINKKVIKNTGQFPMYLIQNNHPAIVSREIYRAVQAEKTRRSASASPSKKTSSTGRSCYASKFALSERLVCGECGTLYRRCTWKRNGKARVVWRCVSRLDYGTKYCHQSPTMDEEPLQQAIMAAINSVMDSKGAICSQITEAAVEETGILPDSAMTLGEINRRLEELETEFNILLQQPDSAVKNAARFGGIANEIASLKGQREKIAARLRKDQTVQLHVHTMEAALDGMSHLMQQWDEEMIRQLVHTVKVISADHIKVFLCNGIEIDQTVNP